jgi:hypothetical protein
MKLSFHRTLIFLGVVAIISAILCVQLSTLDQKEERTMKQKGTEKYVDMNAVFRLTDKERAALETRAEDGDRDAAFKLSQHHAFITQDRSQEFKWLSRAATLEHVIASYNLAFFYLQSNPSDFEQARHWAKIAKKNGAQHAQSLLREIDIREAESRQSVDKK